MSDTSVVSESVTAAVFSDLTHAALSNPGGSTPTTEFGTKAISAPGGTPLERPNTVSSAFITATKATYNDSRGSREDTTASQAAITSKLQPSLYIPENPPPNPIPTGPTGPIPPHIQVAFLNLDSEADYLMASLIPVLLATLLSIPIQVFIASLNSMLPFRSLSRQGGASAGDSLCLSRSSWLVPSCLTGFRLLHRFHDPLAFLGVLLNFLSIILVLLSTETIRLEVTSMGCDSKGLNRLCPYGLRKSDVPIRAAEALLASMVVLVITMGCILARWRTCVAAEPWSNASMAGLFTNPELRDLVRSIPRYCTADGENHRGLDGRISRVLEGRRFRLGFFTSNPRANEQPNQMYGIEIVPATDDGTPVRPTVRNPPAPPRKLDVSSRTKRISWHIKPATKQISIRVTALVLTIGILILILYYENTVPDPPTAFETFMDSQSFGVRLLFAALGTAVSGFWDFYFSRTCYYSSAPTLFRHILREKEQRD